MICLKDIPSLQIELLPQLVQPSVAVPALLSRQHKLLFEPLAVQSVMQ